MAIQPTIRASISASPQLHVLGGYFSIGSTRIPYVTAHMSISEVARYLKTPDQLPGWTDGTTEIEALYQRQLDYRRVKHEILPYLTDTENARPRFFNAFTVALFPYKNHRIRDFQDGHLSAPDLEHTGTQYFVSSGPIKIGLYAPFDVEQPESFSIGELRWNLDETAAVALDGQHRLAACQQLFQIDQDAAEKTKVCVQFVVPSADLGYSGASGAQGDLLSLLRSVFIDLNKHAKPVKRSRLILLDDVDPHSRAVRRLVEKRLRDVDPHTPVVEKRLPLSLVDWHSDDAKFESGPYATTVLMLDRIVQTMLGNVKPVTDWTNKKDVERQYTALKRLGFNPSEACEERYSNFRNAEELWQATFSYPKEDLDQIEEVIGEIVAPAVAEVLTDLKPYKELCELRGEYNMLSTDFSNWYEAYGSQDGTSQAQHRVAAIEDHIKHRDNPPKISEWKHCLEEEIPELKSGNLFFKVVFQAAIFRVLYDLWTSPVAVLEDGEVPERGSKENLEVWSRCLISTLNALWEADSGVFDLKGQFAYQGKKGSLWAGSVLNLDRDAVDFTNSGLQRAAQLLKLVIQLGHVRLRWKEVFDEPVGKTVEEAVENLSKEDPDFSGSMGQTMRRLVVGNSANSGAMWRIVQGVHDADPEEDYDWIVEEAETELSARLNYIWGLLEE